MRNRKSKLAAERAVLEGGEEGVRRSNRCVVGQSQPVKLFNSRRKGLLQIEWRQENPASAHFTHTDVFKPDVVLLALSKPRRPPAELMNRDRNAGAPMRGSMRTRIK